MKITPKLTVRAALSLLLPLVFLATSANGQTSWRNTSVGDWFIASNWSNGVPYSGTVQITNGGTALINCSNNPAAYGPDLYVGLVASTSGGLIVSGPPSPPTYAGGVGGGLHVSIVHVGAGGSAGSGVGGTGTMTVSGGGFVDNTNNGYNSAFLSIGSGSQSSGTVTITDGGSLWNTNDLFVGQNTSKGTLNLQNGGTLLATEYVSIGQDAGSTGSVTVTGAGSALNTYLYDPQSDNNYVSGALFVGRGGSGSLTVSAGGKVVSDSRGYGGAAIGSDSGSTGLVTVTGSSSKWIEVGNMYVGGNGFTAGNQTSVNGGSGTLRIQSGGFVQASGLQFFSNGELTVDNGSTSTPGLSLVGGAGSVRPGGTVGDLVVGKTTAARMELRTGGTLYNNRAYIGIISGGNGSVLVTDLGSQWSNSGSLWVGNQGDGSLEVRNGGIVTSAGNGYIGYSANTTGNVTVSGAGSKWSVSDIYVGGTTQAAGGTGTLQLDTNGTATATTATIYSTGFLNLGANPVLNASLTVLGGAIQFVDTSNTVFANNINVGAGGMRVYTYSHPSTLSGNITGSGGLTKGGSAQIGQGPLTLTGSSNYAGATTLSAGSLLVNGSITSPVTVNSGATLGGNGSVGSVIVNSGGIVAPGNSPGKLTVNGNYTQNSGGILNIEIGGATPGVGGYDQLAVTGTATLNGTLNLTLVNGFRPKVGDTFKIITSSAESGSFATINSSGFTVSPSASASGIQLTVMTVQQGIPVISSATTASATQNQSFSYQITATDSPTSYGASGLPAGLGVNTSNGLISGTPSTSGSFNVTISATNAAGSGTAQLTLTVSAPVPTPTPTPTATPTPTPTPAAQLLNLSTRKQVGTGDNVTIGGFIIVGTDAKKVILRGIGPSAGIPGALADPTLELHDGNGTLATNNDWQDTQRDEIIATGIPPSNNLESAIVATLPAAPASQGGASYSGVLAGRAGGTGIGVLELYDLNTAANAKLANISTRGFVGGGDDVLIGGFIPGPSDRATVKVLIRGLGPSIPVSGALQDPVLELHDGNGNTLVANDDWQQASNANEIAATGIPPGNTKESAILTTLPPSNSGYTAILRGVDGTTGIGLIELYALP